MKFRKKIFLSVSISLLISISSVLGYENEIKLANPNASPEAHALLRLFYSISGQYTLIGQHNYPNTKDRNSQFAASYIGKTPAVFSTDMGFAKDGDKDSYLARLDVIEEIKKQHKQGSIITICWHAVSPTADELVSFGVQPGQTSPEALASVQGQILDKQFEDVLTSGTKLYKRWCSQVDTIAFYLKKLQDARIPILWRPYHEMNGKWFWWGGRVGDRGTAVLYRQMFRRFVNYHKLNNLIWIWSVDRPVKPEMRFEDFYPGNEFLDIISLDVYGNDFQQSYYNGLVNLSKGKPLVLAEVGNPPSLEILKNQPRWAFYITWAGMVRNTLKKQYREMVGDTRILCLEDSVYRKIIASYHSACGLSLFLMKETRPEIVKNDFSGRWIFDEENSKLDYLGINSIPYRMKITQKKDTLAIQKTFILEYTDDMITNEKATLDGKENFSEMWNFPKTTKVTWSGNCDTILIESRVVFRRGDRTSEMVIHESWSMQEQNKVLSIKQYSSSMWGERTITMVFNRE
jgi:mannan endo-1,4-beta-mannosidase